MYGEMWSAGTVPPMHACLHAKLELTLCYLDIQSQLDSFGYIDCYII